MTVAAGALTLSSFFRRFAVIIYHFLRGVSTLLHSTGEQVRPNAGKAPDVCQSSLARINCNANVKTCKQLGRNKAGGSERVSVGGKIKNKRVGKRGRRDVSGSPPSQMAEEERKRLICYTLHIVRRSFCSLCHFLSATL